MKYSTQEIIKSGAIYVNAIENYDTQTAKNNLLDVIIYGDNAYYFSSKRKAKAMFHFLTAHGEPATYIAC